VLFALLRAAHRAGEQHRIVYFSDYQNAPLDHWNLAGLPASVRVFEARRSDVREQLSASMTGRLTSFLSMRTFSAPAFVKAHLLALLEPQLPELITELRNDSGGHLWLYNERNKMARLFRLLLPKFSIIEDGESNYQRIRCPWWKRPARLLQGRPTAYRCYGEDPRCTTIWVQHPERLPEAVRSKGKTIDFLDDRVASEMVVALFGSMARLDAGDTTAILATQPLEIFPGLNTADKQAIYRQIACHLQANGYRTLLKLHPAEDPADYAPVLEFAEAIPGKLPLEAMLVGTAAQLSVVSLWSAAGLGFDNHCSRIQLAADGQADEAREWKHDTSGLQDRLNKLLPPPSKAT